MKKFRFFSIFPGPFGPFEEFAGQFSDLRIGFEKFFPRFSSGFGAFSTVDLPSAVRIEDKETKESRKFFKKELLDMIILFQDMDLELISFQELERFKKLGAWK